MALTVDAKTSPPKLARVWPRCMTALDQENPEKEYGVIVHPLLVEGPECREIERMLGDGSWKEMLAFYPPVQKIKFYACFVFDRVFADDGIYNVDGVVEGEHGGSRLGEIVRWLEQSCSLSKI